MAVDALFLHEGALHIGIYIIIVGAYYNKIHSINIKNPAVAGLYNFDIRTSLIV
jgi:hypothetical protein